MIRPEWIHSWRRISSTGATAFLLLLLAADIAFTLLHFLRLEGFVDSELFSLETDRGYSEVYQYLKVLSIVALLFFVLTRTRVAGYGVWFLLFLYLLLDDALSIHEEFGGYLAANLGFVPALGLRAQDFGELAVSTGVFIVFLTMLSLFYVRGSETFQEVSRHLLVMLVALAFFGIFVDMLHVAVDLGWKISFLLGVVEDGGELLVMSIMAWYVFLLYHRDAHAGSPLRINP